MNYERIVNGVLCRRSTPDGEWTQFSPESLTIAYSSLSGAIRVQAEVIRELERRLQAVRDAAES